MFFPTNLELSLCIYAELLSFYILMMATLPSYTFLVAHCVDNNRISWITILWKKASTFGPPLMILVQ
jgi:hypothetical protein